MSGSLSSIYDTVSYALYLNSKALAVLQEQASTGSRINRVSDDPSDACRVLGLESQQRYLETYMETLSDLVGKLEISSSVLGDMSSALADIKADLTQIVSGTYDQDGRDRIAEGINDTLEQIVSLANTEHSDQYLFAGSATNSAPYIVERIGGEITSVVYQGSYEKSNIEVASGLQTSPFYVGDKIFSSDDRSDPVFLGDTGAKAGTGTSSVCGDVWLTITHDGSNYQLSIDDGASFVTVPSGGDTNQAVTDSRTGRVLYVDTTQINDTGTELVRVPGTYDVFSTLISIRDILQNDRGLSDAQLSKIQDSCLTSLEEICNLVVQASVSVGIKIEFLSDLKDNLENINYNIEEETTQLQEADIAQVAINLTRREVLYEMSLSVAGKLMSLSLLDFIT
jgi:flagellar hook-associated protein 3 FlgL